MYDFRDLSTGSICIQSTSAATSLIPVRRVRNSSTVGQIYSALHKASEASDRSARVLYLLLLATLSFRELVARGRM